jgi:protein involved in polysaccharide export with SLBB domain
MFLALASAAIPTAMADSTAEQYRIGISDKLRVRVFEWQSSTGDSRDLSAVGGDFTVSETGQLTLPLVGEVAAAGLTATEASNQIADQLRLRAGMIDKPNVIVEVIEYRPYYVLGDVSRSGEFPFRPGLTVLRALSVAGGLQSADSQLARPPVRDLVSLQGEQRMLVQTAASLKIKRARLQAELDDKDAIDFPADFPKGQSSDTDAMRMGEHLMFELRRNAIKQQLAALQTQRALNGDEIKVLEQLIEVNRDQLQKTAQEIKRNKGLLENGVVTAARLMALETTAANLQSDQLDANARVFSVREQMAKLDKEMQDLVSKRKEAVIAELQDAEMKLRQAEVRAATVSGLVDQVTTAGLLLAPDQTQSRLPTLGNVQVVIRRGNETITVSRDNDPGVLPGDLITVALTGEGEPGEAQEPAPGSGLKVGANVSSQ